MGRTKCLWRGQFHTIGARLYGVEQVLAQGIRDHGASGLASIQHGVAIAVFIQRDLNAALPTLVCVQQAVAIGIDEDKVTNAGKGYKPKVCQSVRNTVSGCGGVRTGARLIIPIGIRPCIGGAKARRRDDFNRVGSRRYIDKGVTAVTGRRHTVVKRASGIKQIDHHTLDPRLIRIANTVKIKILKHQVSNRAKRRKGKVGVSDVTVTDHKGIRACLTVLTGPINQRKVFRSRHFDHIAAGTHGVEDIGSIRAGDSALQQHASTIAQIDNNPAQRLVFGVKQSIGILIHEHKVTHPNAGQNLVGRGVSFLDTVRIIRTQAAPKHPRQTRQHSLVFNRSSHRIKINLRLHRQTE